MIPDDWRQWETSSQIRLTGAESVVHAHGPGGSVELKADHFEASIRAFCLLDEWIPDDEVWTALVSIGALRQPASNEPEPQHASVGVPFVLGPYRLIRWIGRGSFGVVWAAVHAPSGEMHALKIIDATDATAVTDLKHEARTAWSLYHPNLVVPIALRQDEERWYFAMELVDGKPLDLYIAGIDATARSGEIGRIFRALGSTVEFLHRNGVVHGDLKPSNVLVRRDGTIAVIDFGFACWQRPYVVPARPWEGFSGTPAYLAPEVFLGSRPGPPADWYAVGAILYEILAGRLPHAERKDWLGHRVSGTPPATISVQAPMEELARTAELLLEPDPERRAGAGLLEAKCDPAALSSLDGALIGREREIEILSRAWSQLTSGPLRLEIIGEPGAGKTSLLQWFADVVAVAEPGAVVLRSRCYEHDELPFAALDGLLAGLVAALQSAGIGLEPAEKSNVSALFPGAFEDSPTPLRTADAVQLRRRAVDALQRWLSVLATNRRLLVVLDDIQWADRDSGRLMGEILSSSAQLPVMIVTTSRRDARSAFDEELRKSALHHPTIATINLEALEDGACESLVRRLLGSDATNAPVQSIVEQGDGNPYLITELAMHQLRFGALPSVSLRDLVRARLAALAEPEVEVLRCVSIASGPLEEAIVRTLASQAGAAPGVTAIRLRQHRFIRTASRADAIVMYHDRLREECVALMTEANRLHCHSALLRALEVAGVGAGRLYPHLRALGRMLEARDAAVKAAASAEQGFAFAQAAGWYSVAADLASDAQERSILLERKGEAEFTAGLTGEAGASFRAAREGASYNHRRHLELRASEAWLLAGLFEEGLGVLKPRLDLLGASHNRSGSRVALSVLAGIVPLLVTGPETRSSAAPGTKGDLATVYWTLGKGLAFVDAARGLDYTVRALRAARDAGDATTAAKASCFLAASVFLHIPLLRPFGRRCIAYSRQSARDSADDHLDATVDLWEGMAAVGHGDWALASSRLERALRIFEANPHGHHWERGVAAGLVAWTIQLSGDFAREHELVWRYLRDAIQRGDRYQQMLFSQYVAYVALAEGNPESALELARQIAAAWRSRGYSVLAFYGMLLEVMVHLYRGQIGEARQRWHQDQDAFRRAGFKMVPQTRIDNTLLEARLLLREGRTTHGESGSTQLRRLAHRFRKEARTDGTGYAQWLEHAAAAWRRPAKSAELETLARGLAAAGLETYAYVARWRAGGDPSALQARGVSDPAVWASAFLPLGP